MRFLWACVVAVILAVSVGAQAPAPEVDALTLRRQLLDQHESIGQLQQSLGSCNVQLAQALRAKLDAETKGK